jgi:RNA polymerase sigma-70 factor, ECF subfamily
MPPDFQALTASLREAHAQFAAAVESIRPALHRYCARMTGSVLDGEDVVQETLAQAYYRLGLMEEVVRLRPWLFTIAHHKCVDFLRARRRGAVPLIDDEEDGAPTVEIDVEIEDRDLASHAFSQLVLGLPPRERAAIILSEVLGYSLAEIADILETSVGGVKAALHRARTKLVAAKDELPLRREPPPPAVAAYLEAFNDRDWTRLRSMLEAEVKCELVGFRRLDGRDAVQSSYLATYGRLSYTWELAYGQVDGEPAIVCLREHDGAWIPRHAIRLGWRGDRVAQIRDYAHVPYLLADARLEIDALATRTPTEDTP